MSLSPIPTRLFHLVISLSRPDHRHCLVAEQNSKMQRRRPLAAFPNRAAACSLTKRCVLLRRKMAKVEETYGEGVRGARSSSEYRRGVYAALIVGTNPPHLFAESFSIRQFLFYFYFLFDQSSHPPPSHSQINLSIYRLSVLHVSPHDNRPPHPSRDPPFSRHYSFRQHRFCFNTRLPFYFLI